MAIPDIVPSNFPRNQIVEFGGLPVLDAVPSRGSWDLREQAAEALAKLDVPAPPHLVPGEERDAERLAAAVDDPGSVAWWLPLVSWAGGGFRYAGDHLRELARDKRGEDVTALVLGGTFDHGRVEDDARRPITTARPQIFIDPPGRKVSDAEVEYDEAVVAHTVGAFLEQAAGFPNLRALFVGEIDDDQQSWGTELDATALLEALPRLEEFGVCALGGPQFETSGHDRLRRLTFQGVLDPEVMTNIAACRLPALEHLELWSTEDFSDEQDEDEHEALGALVTAAEMPNLRHLGLREFTFIDETIEQFAASPALPRLHTLDLSWSPLTDKGAQALLENAPAFGELARLNLSRHYMAEETAERVRQAFTEAGVDVDTSNGLRRR